MAYQNIKGTTAQSFKIGKKGVSLSSEAIINADEKLMKYLVASFKNESGETEEHRLLYDFEIPNAYLAKLEFNSESVIFHLADGRHVELSRTMTGVKGPETSTPDAIATFGDDKGQTLTDSGRKFSDSIDISQEKEAENSENLNIPSVKAVVGYVGALSDIVSQRMDGEL